MEDHVKPPLQSAFIIQRGRKSASNQEISKPLPHSGSSRSSVTPSHGGPEDATTAKPSSSETGSIPKASLVGAFRTGNTRIGSERSGSEKDTQIGDGNRHAQILKKKKATKSGSAGSASAGKSITAPILNPYRESSAQRVPSRVRFTQQKSTVPRSPLASKSTKVINFSPISLPARKAGSSAFPSRKQQLPTAVVPLTPVRVKISHPLLPIWQLLDDEYERVNRRTKGNELGGFARRISSTRSRKVLTREPKLIQRTQASDLIKSRIAPKLRFQRGNESLSSEEEQNGLQSQIPTKVPGRRGGPQLAAKKSAARKIEYVDATSSEESSGTSDTDSPMDTDSQEDQLDSEEYGALRVPPPLSNVEVEQQSTVSSKFIPAPRITIPLPQVKAEPEEPIIGELGPSDLLLNAVETFTLSPIRMQATGQLPFLRRNLRKGFLKRCMDLLVPIYWDDKKVTLLVKYDYIDGVVFQTEVHDWICPFCHLLGRFPTREMLNCHLDWDHREVFSEWEKIDETEVRRSWKLQVLVPEATAENANSRNPVGQDNAEMEIEEEEEEDRSPTPDQFQEEDHLCGLPHNTNIPFAALSSLTTDPLPPILAEPAPPTPPPHPKLEEPLLLDSSQRSISRFINKAASEPLSSFRGRSMTGSSFVTTTTAAATPLPSRTRNERYPTLPPPDDPLGPSAKPPYLPAHSDYGGPSVPYSCRPGGPCLFDLLSTLPTKEFGILDWQVLDCEEEIYESDNVKEEYKIMHALWARWIMLHRRQFISNYLEGTISFVDKYWRIIHKAAGWEALRYWLLMLAFNQFLNGHDVAQVLLHYENLTGTKP